MNAAQRPMSVEMRIQHNAVNLDLNVVLMLHDRSVLLLQRSVVAVLVTLVIRKQEKPVVANLAVRVQRDVNQVNVSVRKGHFVGQDLLLNVVQRHHQTNRSAVLGLTTLNQDVTSTDSHVVRMGVPVKSNITKLAVEPGVVIQFKIV